MVLCLASPVFRAMLGPDSNFEEACAPREATTKPYTLLLSDDYHVAFSILLYAIHLQSDKVFRSLDYPTMHNLAVICDKFDCARAVEPWVPFWKDLAGDIGKRWLFTTWVFKAEGAFTSITRRMILEGCYSEPDGPFLVDGVCLDQHVPDGIVGEYP